jgi:hypothetical protein
MPTQLLNILASIAALAVGGLIGAAFGLVQQAALRRNQKLQEAGKLDAGWTAMAGSGKRVAMLLIVLVLIQILCPLLFMNGTQWWVSGGVVGGYAAMLVLRLKNH